ncbi:MAG: hypothetical protein V4622_08785 [Bacteroidota bacterium]
MSDITPFPQAFQNRVKNDSFLGENLLEALNQNSPISIRLNPKKPNVLSLESKPPIDWCENAFYLEERPNFTLDPLYHAGVYYSQEAGSMMLDKVLKQLDLDEQAKILDLCAAPGGKSGLIASFLNNKGLLVSNEVINSRSKILKENLIKWGNSNTVVTNNDPKDFQRLPHFFDAIVVDAPCSGEGMFRKDKDARTEWSEENVNLCAARQKRIVMDVWDSIKPGGFLIYSTCTFNEQENEDNIFWFENELDAEIVNLDFSPFQQDRIEAGAYALPHLVQTEGFYIAVLQKNADSKTIKSPKLKAQSLTRIKDLKTISGFSQTSGFEFFSWNNIVFALPELFVSDIKLLQQELRIVKFCTEIGTLMRDEIIPNEALALNSSLINFPQKIEVTKIEALRYLKGETFDLEGKKGYNLICYQNVPLGWIKHIGNRFNNLYPKDWRIRMKIDSVS